MNGMNSKPLNEVLSKLKESNKTKIDISEKLASKDITKALLAVLDSKLGNVKYEINDILDDEEYEVVDQKSYDAALHVEAINALTELLSNFEVDYGEDNNGEKFFGKMVKSKFIKK